MNIFNFIIYVYRIIISLIIDDNKTVYTLKNCTTDWKKKSVFYNTLRAFKKPFYLKQLFFLKVLFYESRSVRAFLRKNHLLHFSDRYLSLAVKWKIKCSPSGRFIFPAENTQYARFGFLIRVLQTISLSTVVKTFWVSSDFGENIDGWTKVFTVWVYTIHPNMGIHLYTVPNPQWHPVRTEITSLTQPETIAFE